MTQVRLLRFFIVVAKDGIDDIFVHLIGRWTFESRLHLKPCEALLLELNGFLMPLLAPLNCGDEISSLLYQVAESWLATFSAKSTCRKR
jgi:hypothetical protein